MGFRLTDIVSFGRQWVGFTKPGYVSHRIVPSSSPDDAVGDVVIGLVRTGVLAGRVYGSDGRPAVNVAVSPVYRGGGNLWGASASIWPAFR
jgi:hypothetical protein